MTDLEAAHWIRWYIIMHIYIISQAKCMEFYCDDFFAF
jgi:hypothetical protein